MKKYLVLILLLLSFPAVAQVDRFSSFPSTFSIEDNGTLAGAAHHCFEFFPTTVDGDVVAGTNLYRVPVRRAFTLASVKGYVGVTGTTSAVTIDLNEGGTTVLSTKLTIDASENDSSTAATPAVISDSAIAADGILSVDVDSADSGNTAAGLVVQACGYFN